jgi:predicted membrane-bound spermidine synthase
MQHPPLLANLSIGILVIVGNGSLLVLQLITGKLLAPVLGSSLETWTAVIGVFLTGIALGNWYGGQWPATRKTLAIILVLSVLSTLWMLGISILVSKTNWTQSLPLMPRILVLTTVMSLPVATVLSALTPLAIRWITQQLNSSGRTTGMIFALGSLGCLIGNYVTGFWLIPSFALDSIVLVIAAILTATLGLLPLIPKTRFSQSPTVRTLPQLRTAYGTVFLCSFAAMSLEIAGVRLMAQIVGTSLYTWTVIIGVMLLGTSLGNTLGGIIADRTRSSRKPVVVSLLIASGSIVGIILIFIISQSRWFESFDYRMMILAWSFTLFLLPMLALGLISPQVIRASISSPDQTAVVAGRIYAVSTLGAIAGTFLTGFVIVEWLGMFRVVLLAAALPLVAACLTFPVWQSLTLFYPGTIIGGIIYGGLILFNPVTIGIARESSYFTIQIKPPGDDPEQARNGILILQLDRLVHSRVNPADPTFLYYKHEQIQLECLREISSRVTQPRTLVIGGGGYTFPRAAKTLLPQLAMDVVEIDPAVTQLAYEKLSLDPALQIQSFPMDGRQFVRELAKPSTYDMVTLDAVNDLSVPGHLMTFEFNERVKSTLRPDGHYLVSVIDQPSVGQLLFAAMTTLKKSFRHVVVLTPNRPWKPDERGVFVIDASDHFLSKSDHDETVLRPRVAGFGGLMASLPTSFSNVIPDDELARLSSSQTPILLTDQYAPVDWLLTEVYRQRANKNPH